ncbi:hypothetical protein TCON_0623 [Astathelohania contejeani]|uniref:Uncharacterized protein n=1 Tax=Astathelohania contejeani TaxID=164912 RepID=A0ABQ7I156_9MICR|nr:hypothetical protein TCON_0623 [Thelohania contejeani]
MGFSFFKKKSKTSKKEKESKELINTINNSIIAVERQIKIYESEKEKKMEEVRRLYDGKNIANAKSVYKMVKLLEKTIDKLYQQLTVLQTNRLSFIEECGNRNIFDMMKTINKENEKYGLDTEKIDKVVDSNVELIENRIFNQSILTDSFTLSENYDDEFSEIFEQGSELKNIQNDKIEKIIKENELEKL